MLGGTLPSSLQRSETLCGIVTDGKNALRSNPKRFSEARVL